MSYFKETNKYYPKFGVYIKHYEYKNMHIGIKDAIFNSKTDEQLSINFNQIVSIYEQSGVFVARLSYKIKQCENSEPNVFVIKDKYAIYDMKTGDRLSPFFDRITDFNEETQKYIARTDSDLFIYRLGTNKYNNVKLFDSNGSYRTTVRIENDLFNSFIRCSNIIHNHTDLAISMKRK